MGWLRKTWAALVALFVRQAVAEMPVAAAAPVVEAPAETPVSAPGQLPQLDFEIVSSPLKALIEQLEKAFPVPAIKPTNTMNELQYAAGCRAVVEWVKLKQKRGQA